MVDKVHICMMVDVMDTLLVPCLLKSYFLYFEKYILYLNSSTINSS